MMSVLGHMRKDKKKKEFAKKKNLKFFEHKKCKMNEY